MTEYLIDAENVAEMARLTKQAQLITRQFGLLPTQIDLTSRKTVLDVGCGPGEWVFAMAQQHSWLQVTGIDISHLMTTYAQTYAQENEISNAYFQVMDARRVLDFPNNSFDLIHARFLSGFHTNTSWRTFLSECWRLLRPGGMVCVIEPYGLGTTTSPSFSRYKELLLQAALKEQRMLYEGDREGITPVLAYFIAKAGFERIDQSAQILNYSVGMPAHQAMFEDWRTAFKLLQPFILRNGISTQDEIDLLYARILAEMQLPDFCGVTFYQTVWGEKTSQK